MKTPCIASYAHRLDHHCGRGHALPHEHVGQHGLHDV